MKVWVEDSPICKSIKYTKEATTSKRNYWFRLPGRKTIEIQEQSLKGLLRSFYSLCTELNYVENNCKRAMHSKGRRFKTSPVKIEWCCLNFQFRRAELGGDGREKGLEWFVVRWVRWPSATQVFEWPCANLRAFSLHFLGFFNESSIFVLRKFEKSRCFSRQSTVVKTRLCDWMVVELCAN